MRVLAKYDVRLNDPQAVRRLLGRVVNQLLRDEITEGKARTIGYLANIMVGVMESADLEQRLEALEQATYERTGAHGI